MQITSWEIQNIGIVETGQLARPVLEIMKLLNLNKAIFYFIM